MTENVQKHELEASVDMNPKIIEAARDTVAEKPAKEPVALTEYKGMFVAEVGSSDIQPLSFFTHNGIRYVVGPLRKEEKGR